MTLALQSAEVLNILAFPFWDALWTHSLDTDPLPYSYLGSRYLLPSVFVPCVDPFFLRCFQIQLRIVRIMEAGGSPSMTEPMSQQREPSLRPHTLREKTKRPQLSCNPCRSRKVKVGVWEIADSCSGVLMAIHSSVIVYSHVPPAPYIRSPECVNMISPRRSGNPSCKPKP